MLEQPVNKKSFFSIKEPNKIKVFCIVGTRPEAIKMAPIILKLKEKPWAEVVLIATAQHREMMDSALALFKLVPDIDLNIMKPGQSLANLTAELTAKLDTVFKDRRPNIVLAQGDTTTVFVTALLSFYNHVPFCHVEAGLRSYDKNNPFPEEMNRVLVGSLTDIHFAPTSTAKEALLNSGIAEEQIYITGNTVIDALKRIVALEEISHPINLDSSKKTILVTSHRRENHGAPLYAICHAIRKLVERHPDIQIVYAVHPNPEVQKIVKKELSNCERVILSNPLDYMEFVALMRDAYLILTDSGGIQEEATALGKPVLILRETTERMEGVVAGVTKLIGTDELTIVNTTTQLLNDKTQYLSMIKNGLTLYGDGTAADKISEILEKHYVLIKSQNYFFNKTNETKVSLSKIDSDLEKLIIRNEKQYS